MSAGIASAAVFEFAAAEPCVWAISWDVLASAARRDGDFSGRDEAVGHSEYDPAGAGVGTGERTASLAVVEAEDRARFRGPGER